MSEQRTELYVPVVEVSSDSLAELVSEGVRLRARVNGLLQEMTLKEELLRAYRRHAAGLNDVRSSLLEADLEETRKRVESSYGR